MPTFRGFPACECLAEWLPHFEAELKRRGVVQDSIDIAQLIGDAAASGNTHKGGGAFDIWQHDALTQIVAREMGAAAWNRVAPWWTGSPHTHGILNGCPHNVAGRYQIGALAAGFNGLGSGGRGGPDYGQGPRNLRHWRDGIKWAIEQGDDMPNYTEWSKADRQALAGDVARATVDLLLKEPITRAGDTVKKALRVAAGLPKDDQ